MNRTKKSAFMIKSVMTSITTKCTTIVKNSGKKEKKKMKNSENDSSNCTTFCDDNLSAWIVDITSSTPCCTYVLSRISFVVL